MLRLEVPFYSKAIALTAIFAACDDGGSDKKPASGSAPLGVVMCSYDRFEVEVTNGPSKDLRIEGSLLLMSQPPSSALTGVVATADAMIPVTGALYRDGQVALTFHSDDGYLMGLGNVGSDFCKEGATLTGIEMGPAVSSDERLDATDTGHWLVSNPSRIVTINPGLLLPLDPAGGTQFDANSGCSTNGNTQTCTSTYPDAGSALACTQVTVTCTFDGTKNTCDKGVSMPVLCPGNN